MAFDLEKFKNNLSAQKLKGIFSKTEDGQLPSWARHNSKLVEFKEGLQNIKNVLIHLLFQHLYINLCVFLLV